MLYIIFKHSWESENCIGFECILKTLFPPKNNNYNKKISSFTIVSFCYCLPETCLHGANDMKAEPEDIKAANTNNKLGFDIPIIFFKKLILNKFFTNLNSNCWKKINWIKSYNKKYFLNVLSLKSHNKYNIIHKTNINTSRVSELNNPNRNV